MGNESITIIGKTTKSILGLAIRSEAVQLVLQTILESHDKEGEYTLDGTLVLRPVE
jgi:hypothetical protein